MFQFPGLLGYSGLGARWAAPPDLSQPSTPDLLMTPRHPPRALRSLTTPIGPPLSLSNPGEPERLETRESTCGHFQSKPWFTRPSVSRRGGRLLASHVSVRVHLTRPARLTSSKAVSYCTVVEIATHPILRVTRVNRENPIHSHPTRVCVSCVTNTGLPKSTNLCTNTAGKADRNAGCSWSGQGARP